METISEKTKIEISKRFGIEPIVTGGDLKNALVKRNNDIKTYKKTAQKLETALLDLRTEIEQLREEIEALEAQILAEKDFDKKRELEQQYDMLEDRLNSLLDEQKALETDQAEHEAQKIEPSVPLLNGNAVLEDNSVVVTTLNGRRVHFSLDATDQEITESVNTLAIYEKFSEYHLEGFVFSGDPLSKTGDTISTSTQTITDNLLDAFSLAEHNYLLTLQDVNMVEDFLKEFIGKDTPKVEVQEILKREGMWKENQFEERMFRRVIRKWKLKY